MHDINGRRLCKGDSVRVKDFSGRYFAGHISHTFPGAQTCNIQVAVPMLGTCGIQTCNSKDSELIVTAEGELPEARPIEKPVEPVPA